MPAWLLFLLSLTPCYGVYQQASRVIDFIPQDAIKLLQVQTCHHFPIQFIFLSRIFFLLHHFTNSFKKSYYYVPPQNHLVIELTPVKNCFAKAGENMHLKFLFSEE